MVHAFECIVIIGVLLQPYVVDLEGVTYEGFEYSSRPEGIPSQSEYLAEYCSAAVCFSLRVVFISCMFIIFFFFFSI